MPPPDKTDAKFSELTVLIVDNEEFMRNLVERMLFDLGVKTVFKAEGAKDAMRVIQTEYRDIDLILLDIDMPGIDGLQFLKMIRKTSKKEVAELPIVMLTGHADMTNVKKAVELGIGGFLTKPVAAEKLKAQILSVVNPKDA